MRRLQIKFPNQIRISGWDFGSSARAMNQAGGYISTQADLRTVRKSTTERKSMSTKTTIKRIALVAVSALGLGVLTSVAPASAASATVSLGTASATAGITGQEMRIAVPVTYTASDGSDTVTVGMGVTSKPGTSSAAASNTYFGATTATSMAAITDGGVANFTANAGAVVSSQNWVIRQTVTAAGDVATYNVTNTAYFYFTPDKAGSYTLSYYLDADSSGTVSSGDTVKYLSVTVADAPAAAVVVSKPLNATFALYDANDTANGAWLKLQVNDASGTASQLNSSQTVKITVPSGVTLYSAGKSGSESTINAAGPVEYQLGTASFDIAGVAYVNLRGTTAGTYTISAEVVGSGVTAGSTSVKFAADTAYAAALTTGFLDPAGDATSAAPIVGSTNAKFSSATAATASSAATSQSMYLGTTTSEGVVAVTITSSYIWGTGGSHSSDIVVTASDTKATTDAEDGLTTTRYKASFSVPAALTINSNYAYKTVQVNSFTAASTAGSAVTITGAASAVSSLSLTAPTASTVLSAPGAKTTLTVRCKDQFGAAKANTVLTPVITGRNSALVVSPAVTDASGYATFSYTDASTSTTNLQDLISFTGCSSTATKLTVNYTSTTNLGVSTLTWTAGGGYADSDYYEGYAKTAISGGDDPSTNAASSLTFTVKDASGSAIAGVPVTFALSGNASSAIKKTATVDYTTVYTSASGTASVPVFAWAPGKSTITATAGGKTATGYITWKNSATLSHARVLSATANGNVVSLKVVDRFGNGVESVSISLSRTGTGYFGTGSSTATATTDENGTVDVQFNGNGTVKALLGTGAVQAYDVAGKIAATAVTAAVAGTTTGTGASFAPAGVYTVSVEVSDTSSSAVDAANEATDAANAATDAANAAAEAADAATAAAQDAQAAVAELATKVASLIAGIKAQITTLTNLVIKIQKKVKA